MSKPRFRWATRDEGFGQQRAVWAMKPDDTRYPGLGWCFPEGYEGCHHKHRPATKGEFIKRFGRDLRPGEIRRLP